MPYSITKMEAETSILRRRLDALKEGSGPEDKYLHAAYKTSLEEALKIIAGLGGRLSAVEEQLRICKAEKRYFAGGPRRQSND